MSQPTQRSSSCPLVFGATSLLLGVLSHEGYRYFSDDDLSEGLSELRWVRTLRTFVQNVFRYHLQKIYDILAHNYHDWDHPKDRQAISRGLVELLGDGLFAAPVIELAQRHVACNAASTFLYSFVRDRETAAGNESAVHRQADELSTVFGAPLADGIEPFGSRFSPEEKRLSEVVMPYWVNFIRSGNPNGVRHQRETEDIIEWPSYDSPDQPYLLISNTPSVHHHYKSRKMALWLELIPKIHRPDPSPNPLIHLLHDFRNRSTFDDRGTRQIDLLDLGDQSTQPQTTPSAFDYMETSGHHMDVPSLFFFSTSSSSSKFPNLPRRLTSPRPPRNRTTLLLTPSETLVHTSFRPWHDPVATFNPDSQVPAEGTDMGTLKVTLTIGLGLLLLNLTVFGATFYQWRRLDRTSGGGLCIPDFVDKSVFDATSNHRSALRYDAVSASYLTGADKNCEPTPPYDGTPIRTRFECEDTTPSADKEENMTTKDDSLSSVELRTKDDRVENHVTKYPSTEV